MVVVIVRIHDVFNYMWFVKERHNRQRQKCTTNYTKIRTKKDKFYLMARERSKPPLQLALQTVAMVSLVTVNKVSSYKNEIQIDAPKKQQQMNMSKVFFVMPRERTVVELIDREAKKNEHQRECNSAEVYCSQIFKMGKNCNAISEVKQGNDKAYFTSRRTSSHRASLSLLL